MKNMENRMDQISEAIFNPPKNLKYELNQIKKKRTLIRESIELDERRRKSQIIETERKVFKISNSHIKTFPTNPITF